MKVLKVGTITIIGILPLRGVGVGFEEPHLRLVFYINSSWDRNFH